MTLMIARESTLKGANIFVNKSVCTSLGVFSQGDGYAYVCSPDRRTGFLYWSYESVLIGPLMCWASRLPSRLHNRLREFIFCLDKYYTKMALWTMGLQISRFSAWKDFYFSFWNIKYFYQSKIFHFVLTAHFHPSTFTCHLVKVNFITPMASLMQL